MNTDAFADDATAELVELLTERYATVHHLIHSIAALSCADPQAGQSRRAHVRPSDGARTAATPQVGEDSPATPDPATA